MEVVIMHVVVVVGVLVILEGLVNVLWVKLVLII